jgi:hypothetical protein
MIAGRRRKPVTTIAPERILGKAGTLNARKLADQGMDVNPEEFSEVLQEARLGQLERPRPRRKFWSEGQVSRLAPAPGLPTNLEWPNLVSGKDEISLTLEELVAELDVILDMRESYPKDGVLLYSLQVAQPSTWRWPADGPLPEALEENAGRLAELRTGYVYHELMYRLSAGQRGVLLRQILSGAQSVMVTIRANAGQSPLRSTVEIKPGPREPGP